MKLESAYQRLPPLGQNIASSLYGWQLIRGRYGREYRSLEQAVFQREHWGRERIREFANRRLQSMVRHAAETVPYYRRLFADLRLDPQDIRTPEDLGAIPILEKEAVRQNPADFSSQVERRSPYTVVNTSGTTGSGLHFPFSLDAEREQWATWWRYRRRFGIDRQTWCAVFFGRTVVPHEQSKPPFWRINWPGRQIFFSGCHMKESLLDSYVDELNRTQPPWIHGYPSRLALLAAFILEKHPLDYSPRVVTTGAESLLPHQKTTIERAFGTKCRQHYGMTEGVANISECPEGNLHVDEDYACVEFVPHSDKAWRIVGTGYTNYLFPLIRYAVGDIAEVEDAGRQCPCGRCGRLVRSVDGRIEDYVITPDGRFVGGLNNAFKDVLNVKECQLYQDRLDRLVVRVVRGKQYTRDDEYAIRAGLRERMGALLNIEFDYETRVQRSSRGKLRLVISALPQAQVSHLSMRASCHN
jgi:phenylacetate-CoA ligase